MWRLPLALSDDRNALFHLLDTYWTSPRRNRISTFNALKSLASPTGFEPVAAVRRCPGPLDDGDETGKAGLQARLLLGCGPRNQASPDRQNAARRGGSIADMLAWRHWTTVGPEPRG